ncbi:MAG TPA: hypothetical protein VL326_37160, partial [Kofleriaceae bacterium]|nr:hypothetical protein [Kofleriaceae bacterium]
MASRFGTVALLVAKSVLRILWVSTMVLTPLFGFWLASSLAAYHNASQWLSLLVGLLLFPIVPVAWEAFYVWRRNRKGKTDRAILTGLDRLVLRTLLVNGLFLGGMMWQAKDDALRAITVRGDWMFDGHDGPVASTFRSFLLAVADHLERDKPDSSTPYGKSDQAPTTIKPPSSSDDQEMPAEPTRSADEWPLPVAPDPLVTNMPADAQASIETVGAYLAANFPDKRKRTKAAHDFVVNRLHYDFDALAKIQAGDYEHTPPQTAEAVFASRTGVCEGYA